MVWQFHIKVLNKISFETGLQGERGPSTLHPQFSDMSNASAHRSGLVFALQIDWRESSALGSLQDLKSLFLGDGMG